MYWFENEQLKRTYSGDEMEILEEDSTLPFDTNWNWLHEAVEFIEKFEDKVGNQKNFKIFNRVLALPIETKKEAVFTAVSDFAKLYNEKKL